MKNVSIDVNCEVPHFVHADFKVEEVEDFFPELDFLMFILYSVSYPASTTRNEVVNSRLRCDLLVKVVMTRKNNIYTSIRKFLLPMSPKFLVFTVSPPANQPSERPCPMSKRIDRMVKEDEVPVKFGRFCKPRIELFLTFLQRLSVFPGTGIQTDKARQRPTGYVRARGECVLILLLYVAESSVLHLRHVISVSPVMVA